MTELINDAISDGISLDGNGTNDTLAPVVTEETNTAKPDSIYGSGDAVYIKTTDLAASDETSKAPIPPTTADETSKAPMLPAATEKTSKVPIPRAATGMNSANSASGSMNETISTVPKPLPPGILLSTSQAAPTNGDSGAGGGGDLSRIDSSAAMVTEASPAPLPELSAAEASEVASASSQRSGGPPPVKVRRREPPPSQQQQQQQQLGLADSAAEQQFLPPRNYQFIAGDLEYFIVCGLPLTTTDASLKRTFKGLLKKSLCEISQVIIVPEIDSKTVLVFSGNGATATAKVAKNLTLKRLQKKLQSSLFVSRFPEDANLKNLRAYASYSEEYLYKWTRLYFCPVSLQLAEEIQCQHFLVSNLSQSLLRSPSDLLIKFSQTMPTARSFFLPVDESESPLGYMLVRFNKSEDCLACYRLLQKHYSMEMTFVSLLEVCRLPGGYQVPAHNLLNWCRLERPAAGASVQQSQPAQPRIVLDDPVRSPYLCTCHPAGQSVAPPPEKLHLVANELETTLLANPGASIVDFKSLLVRIC